MRPAARTAQATAHLRRPRTLSARPLALAIQGATGRMGTRLIHLIQSDQSLTLAAALDRPDHPALGADVGPLVGLGPISVPLQGALDRSVDVAIDFSAPAASIELALACVE